MSTIAPPNPTEIVRLVHVNGLRTLLIRGALHATNATPEDGLHYRTIHNVDVQANRHIKEIPCGPGGTAHDYVPFYFGPLSVMLLNLKTGRVPGYDEGQRPLIYLVTTAQAVVGAGSGFVFSDGHGLAYFTNWYDDLVALVAVDWSLVRARYWAEKPDDNDRQRRKQAEFLVWNSLDWSLIQEIVVYDDQMKATVEALLLEYPERSRPQVSVKRDWYYY
jgi:hypothetical protein